MDVSSTAVLLNQARTASPPGDQGPLTGNMADMDPEGSAQPRIEPLRLPGPNRRIHPPDADYMEAVGPMSSSPLDIGIAITSVVSLADTDIPELQPLNSDITACETEVTQQTPLDACETVVMEETALDAHEIEGSRQVQADTTVWETPETLQTEGVDEFNLKPSVLFEELNEVKLKPDVIEHTDRCRGISGEQSLNEDVDVKEKRKMDKEVEKNLMEASDHVRLLGVRIVDVRSVTEDRKRSGDETDGHRQASVKDMHEDMVTDEVPIVNDDLPEEIVNDDFSEAKVSKVVSPSSEVVFPEGNTTSDDEKSTVDNTGYSETVLPMPSVAVSRSENGTGLSNASQVCSETESSIFNTDCSDTRIPIVGSTSTEIGLSIVTASCTETELTSVTATCVETKLSNASAICTEKELADGKTSGNETELPSISARYSESMLPNVKAISETSLSNMNEGSIDSGLSDIIESSVESKDCIEGDKNQGQDTDVVEHDVEQWRDNQEIPENSMNEPSTDVSNEKEMDFGGETLMIVDVRSLSEESDSGVNQTPNATQETVEHVETEHVNMETVLDPVSGEISKSQAKENNKVSERRKQTETESLSLGSEGSEVETAQSQAEEELEERTDDELRMAPAILNSSSVSSSNSSSTSSLVSSSYSSSTSSLVTSSNISLSSATLTSPSVSSSTTSSSSSSVVSTSSTDDATAAPIAASPIVSTTSPSGFTTVQFTRAVSTSCTDAVTAAPIAASSIVSTASPSGYTTVQLTSADTPKTVSSEQNSGSANKSIDSQSIISKNNENSTEGLPVIANVFSVKSEPADDGSYGVMPGSSKQQTTMASQVSNNRASISNVIKKLHHGKTVLPSTPIPASTLNAKNIKLQPVGPGNKQVISQVARAQGMGGPTQGAGTQGPIRFVYTTVSTTSQHNTALVNKAASQANGAQRMVLTNGQVRMVPSSTSPSVVQPQGQSMKVCYQYNPGKNTSEIKQKPILPRGAVFETTQTVTGVNASVATATGVIAVASKEKPFVGPKVVKDRLKEKQQAAKYINIQTVGVDKITELIARKNPIPTYKPPPLPDKLKNSAVQRKTYPCYECGDTFYFENSLNIHLTRCSMRLQYNCTRCAAQLQFTNKCQLLNHLRSHLNIDKTQAVPIHIKSDSVQIKTVYDEIRVNKNFEWYNEKKVRFGPNYDTCVVCSSRFTSEDVDEAVTQRSLPVVRSQHFEGCRGDLPFKCDICRRYMTNACSLALHKSLHTILKDGKIAQDMICPECGLNFGRGDPERFYMHLMTQCFHLNRVWVWECGRCKVQCGSQEEVRQHLMTRLDNYYKCTACPMALKSLDSFYNHYRSKHGSLRVDMSKYVKMIYRCHFCDTLIDDRQFLLSHLEKHLTAYTEKGHFVLSCLQCTLFSTKHDRIKLHLATVHRDYVCDVTKCGDCYKPFDNVLKLLNHEMTVHPMKICLERAMFCKCGLVCRSTTQLNHHACLLDGVTDSSNKPIDVDGASPDRGESKECRKKRNSGDAKDAVTVVVTPYQCPMCQQYFTSSAGRTNHVVSHRNRREFVCINCLRIDFASFHDLRSHEILCIAQSKNLPPLPKDNINGKTKNDASAKRKTDNRTGLNEAQKPKPANNNSGSESDTENEKNFGKVRLSLKGVAQEKWFTDKGETFKCEKCDKKFSRNSKLAEHVSAEHSLHTCHLCGLMYNSLNHLKTHLLKSHKGKKPMYYCWVCRGRKVEKCYNEKTALEKHLTSKHKLKLVDQSRLVPEWPEDDLKGITPEPQVHTLKVSEEGPPVKRLKMDGETMFRCAKCAFTAEKQEEFRAHIAQHGSADTVQCLECGLCFTVLPSLQRHLFMVHKIRNFKAYVKDNAIEEPKELDSLDLIEREPEVSHDESESESEEEETGNALECKVCYKAFESEHSLKQHMRVHGMAFIRKSRRRSAVKKAARAKKSDGDLDTSSGSISVDDVEEPRTKKARTVSGSDADYNVAKKARTNSGSDTEHWEIKKHKHNFTEKRVAEKTATVSVCDTDMDQDLSYKARTVSGSDTQHRSSESEGRADIDEPEAQKVGTLSGSDMEGSETDEPRESLKMKISLSGMKASVN